MQCKDTEIQIKRCCSHPTRQFYCHSLQSPLHSLSSSKFSYLYINNSITTYMTSTYALVRNWQSTKTSLLFVFSSSGMSDCRVNTETVEKNWCRKRMLRLSQLYFDAKEKEIIVFSQAFNVHVEHVFMPQPEIRRYDTRWGSWHKCWIPSSASIRVNRFTNKGKKYIQLHIGHSMFTLNVFCFPSEFGHF